MAWDREAEEDEEGRGDSASEAGDPELVKEGEGAGGLGLPFLSSVQVCSQYVPIVLL